jgi:carbon monoxide dehydrogenase subunit G
MVAALTDARQLRNMLPVPAAWRADQASVEGEPSISIGRVSGIFRCMVAIVDADGAPDRVALRISGRQVGGPVRWNAALELRIAVVDENSSRVHLSADVRVAGAGATIRGVDIADALRRLPSALSPGHRPEAHTPPGGTAAEDTRVCAVRHRHQHGEAAQAASGGDTGPARSVALILAGCLLGVLGTRLARRARRR